MSTFIARCEHSMGNFEETKIVEADTAQEAVSYLSSLGYITYEIVEQPDEDLLGGV